MDIDTKRREGYHIIDLILVGTIGNPMLVWNLGSKCFLVASTGLVTSTGLPWFYYCRDWSSIACAILVLITIVTSQMFLVARVKAMWYMFNVVLPRDVHMPLSLIDNMATVTDLTQSKVTRSTQTLQNVLATGRHLQLGWIQAYQRPIGEMGNMFLHRSRVRLNVIRWR